MAMSINISVGVLALFYRTVIVGGLVIDTKKIDILLVSLFK